MSAVNPYASPEFGGKELVYQAGELAPISARFLGALIDGIIAVPISALLGGVLAVGLAATPLRENPLALQVASYLIGTAMGAGLFMAIHGYLLATRGQTVGKMVMKTRIVGDDGSAVPFNELIAKRYLPIWIVTAIPFLGGVIGLVNALLIFRGSRKCLHDDIAGTKVVQMTFVD